MENLFHPSLFKKRFIIACDIVADGAVFSKALKIALVVGTILNLINQGDALIAWEIEKVSWGKLLLTYCVPFLVSTYTAVSIGFEFKIGDVSPVTSQVRCKRCKTSMLTITKGELISECAHCGLKTKWQLK
ncbi:nitrate/nitrite transporter NrtS [Sulfuricurvum sp.]|uniref:nitrate/nitrite transporter NrtS n=1 Tax=Sulfuricurvum sp. TaxID=2025608 RepID=UPI003BB75CD0